MKTQNNEKKAGTHLIEIEYLERSLTTYLYKYIDKKIDTKFKIYEFKHEHFDKKEIKKPGWEISTSEESCNNPKKLTFSFWLSHSLEHTEKLMDINIKDVEEELMRLIKEKIDSNTYRAEVTRLDYDACDTDRGLHLSASIFDPNATLTW